MQGTHDSEQHRRFRDSHAQLWLLGPPPRPPCPPPPPRPSRPAQGSLSGSTTPEPAWESDGDQGCRGPGIQGRRTYPLSGAGPPGRLWAPHLCSGCASALTSFSARSGAPPQEAFPGPRPLHRMPWSLCSLPAWTRARVSGKHIVGPPWTLDLGKDAGFSSTHLCSWGRPTGPLCKGDRTGDGPGRRGGGGDGAPSSHSLQGLGLTNGWLTLGVGGRACGDIVGGTGMGSLPALRCLPLGLALYLSGLVASPLFPRFLEVSPEAPPHPGHSWAGRGQVAPSGTRVPKPALCSTVPPSCAPGPPAAPLPLGGPGFCL